MKLTRPDRRFFAWATIYSIVASLACVTFGVAIGRAQLGAAPEPVYDIAGTARRPLIIDNGVTKQLPTTDYLSTVGGLTTNATAAAAGDLETTTLTCSGASTLTGLATLTGGFTLGANSSANSHKITSITDGSSAQDVPAFHQIADALTSGGLSGLTTNRTIKATSATTIGNAWADEDGTTWGKASKFTITESSGDVHGYGACTIDGRTTTAGITNSGQLTQSGVVTVSIGTSQNDWNPTGLSTATTIAVTATTTSLGINGIVAQPTGTILTLYNAGANSISIANLNGGSSAANQFSLGGTVALNSGCALTVRYSGSKWVDHGFSHCDSLTLNNFTATGTTVLSQLQYTVQQISTTGSQNNVGVNSTTAVLQYTGAGSATFTGLTSCTGSSTVGRILYVQNTSGNDLTLSDENGSSTLGNRLKNPGAADITLKGTTTSSAVYICATPGPYWQLLGFASSSNNIPTLFTSTKNTGTITLSSGTGTATVTSGTVCVCTDTTATNVVQCAVSSTTLTATGTGTDVVAYHCF